MASHVHPINAAEEKAVLEGAVAQLRAKYSEVCGDYRHLGTKIFTLTATELAVITFIFAFNTKFNLQVLYGAVFFGIGIAALVFSIALLFWAITSNQWASPGDIGELDKLSFATHAEYLRYLKNDYLEAYIFCRRSFDKRRRIFDIAVMLFIAGAIILMLIKFGGTKI